jgi:hypothetical protein
MNERRTENPRSDNSRVGPNNVQEFWTLSVRAGLCPVGGIWKHDFSHKIRPFLPNLDS